MTRSKIVDQYGFEIEIHPPTPEIIERNEMRATITYVPPQAVEVHYIELDFSVIRKKYRSIDDDWESESL